MLPSIGSARESEPQRLEFVACPLADAFGVYSVSHTAGAHKHPKGINTSAPQAISTIHFARPAKARNAHVPSLWAARRLFCSRSDVDCAPPNRKSRRANCRAPIAQGWLSGAKSCECRSAHTAPLRSATRSSNHPESEDVDRSQSPALSSVQLGGIGERSLLGSVRSVKLRAYLVVGETVPSDYIDRIRRRKKVSHMMNDSRV